MSNWLDLSNVSNILRQTYVNGFLDASGPMIGRADVSFNQKLFVSGDVSLNSRLFVGQDASFNNNVFVKNYVFSSTPLSSDNSNKLATTAYVQDKLSVLSNSASFVGDVTMFNRLYVYGDVSFGSNLFILQNSILDGDVSANTRLYVGNDVSLNAKLFVARDSSLNQRLYVGGDVSMQRRLFVSGDVSLNTRLYVGADVSLGSRLFVAGDVSLNGQVSVPTQVASDNSTKVATTQYVTTALGAFSGAYATFRGDVSINNRLFVGSDVSLQGRLFVNNDASINSNLSVGGNVLINGLLSSYTYQTRLVVSSGFIIPASTSNLSVTTIYSQVTCDNGYGYISTNAGLYRTSDYGATWTLVNSTVGTIGQTQSVPKTLFADNTGQYVQAATNTGFSSSATIKISTNYGVTFTTPSELGGSFWAGDGAGFFMNGAYGYVVWTQGRTAAAYRTINYGQTWTQVTNPPTPVLNGYGPLGITDDGSKYLRFGVNISTLYVSSDYGNTWTTLSGVSGSSNIGINSNAQYILRTSSGNVYVSSNSGTSFTTVAVAGVTGSLSELIYMSSDGSTMTVGNYYSTNYGVTWTNYTAQALYITKNLSYTLGISGTTVKYDKQTSAYNTTLTGTFNVLSDGSFGGRLFLNSSTIANADISANSRLFVARDVSMGSRLFVNSDISANQKLFVGADSSFGGNLYVVQKFTQGGDLSANSRLYLSSDASFGGRLYVAGDVSLNGQVSVPTPLSSDNSTKVATTAYVKTALTSLTGSSATFSGDVSINNRLYIGGDASMSSRLFAAGDVSLNSRLYVGSDVSFGGSLQLANSLILNTSNSKITMVLDGAASNQINVLGAVYVSQGQSIVNDLSLGGRLFLANDASFGGRLFSAGDVSFNQRLYLGSDLSMGGNLYVNQRSIQNGDVSMNKRLYVGSDASFGGKFFVAGDVSLNGLVSVPTPLSTDNSTKVATTAYVKTALTALTGASATFSGDVSINNRLYVGTDVSFGGNLFTNGNITSKNFYGNTFTLGTSTSVQVTPNTSSASTPSWTFNGINWSWTASSASYNELTVCGPFNDNIVNADGNYYDSGAFYNSSGIPSGSFATTTVNSIGTVNGEYIQLRSSIPLVMSSYKIANGDVLMRAAKTFYIVGSNDGTTWYPIQFFSVPANPYSNRFQYLTNNPTIIVNNQYAASSYGATTLTTTTYGTNTTNSYTYFRMIITSIFSTDTYFSIAEWNIQFSTPNNSAQLYLDSTKSNTLDVSSNFAVTGDVSLNSRLFIASDVSLGSRFFVMSDTSLNGSLFVNSRTIQGGDLSANSRLFVGSDSSFGGNLYVNQRSIQNGDVSMNARLSVGSDASFGGKFFVAGDVSLNGQVSVPTPLSTDNSTKVATTAFVKTALTDLTGASSTFSGDVSINFRLYVGSDASLQGRLFVNNDASFNRRLYVAGDVSFGSSLFVAGDASFNRRLYVGSDVSLGGNLSLTGNVAFSYAKRVAIPLSNTQANSINQSAMTTSALLNNGGAFSCSNSGQYVCNGFGYSTNYGTTYTSIGINNTTYPYALYVFVSGTGQYMTTTVSNGTNGSATTAIYVSNNYGTSWNQITYPVPPYQAFMACSDDGTISYLRVLSTSFVSYFYKSFNFGTSWTNITGSNNVGGTQYQNYMFSLNPTGQYITMNLTHGGNEASNALMTSSDYGVTWTTVAITGAYGLNGAAKYCDIPIISDNGQYVYAKISATSYISSNYGVTFTTISDGITGLNIYRPCATSNFGYIFVLGPSPNIYYSTNYASTWTAVNIGSFTGNTGGGGTYPSTGLNVNKISRGGNTYYFAGQTATTGTGYISVQKFDLFNLVYNNANLIMNTTNTNQLDISGNVSVTQTFLALNDVSMGGRLYAAGDASINSRLYLGSDLSMGGNLYVNQRSVQNGDVSMNARLSVGSDASLNGNVYVGKDLTVNGNLTVRQYNVRQTITTVDYQLMVAEDLSVNGRLFLSNDASINQRLYVGKDASLGSRLFVNGDVSFNQTLYVGSFLSTGGRLFVGNDVSINGNLYLPYLNSYPLLGAASITTSSFGQTWTSYASRNTGNYSGPAVSSTGQYQTVSSSANVLYSSNYGQTWANATVNTGPAAFGSTAISADGKYLIGVAGQSSGKIFYSSDFGQTWNGSNLTLDYYGNSLAMSATGQYCVFGKYTHQPIAVYYSSNYGQTWTATASAPSSNGGIKKAAISGDGTRLLVGNSGYGGVGTGNGIWYSTNAGTTWTQANLTSVTIVDIKMSYTGQYCIASKDNGIYYSSNYGVTWTLSTSSPINSALALDSTGQYGLATAGFEGGSAGVYYTTNYGQTWTLSNRTTGNFHVALSSNGLYGIIASSNSNTGIYQQTNASSSATVGGIINVSGGLMANDISANSRLFVTSNSILGGTLTVSQSTVLGGDVSANSRFFVGSDASFGGNHFVAGRSIKIGDLSANNRLFVAGDVSMGSRLFVVSDISTNQRLFVGQDTSLNGSLFVNLRTIQNGDISANSRLFLSSDASFGGRLFVAGDVSLNGNVNINGQVTAPTPLSTDNSTRVATTAYVKTALNALTGASATFSGDVSVNYRLYVAADVSLQGRLFVNNDASFNQRLYVGGDVSFGNRLYVAGDVSMGGSLGLAGGNFYVNNSKSLIVNPATFGQSTLVLSTNSFGYGYGDPSVASYTGQYILASNSQDGNVAWGIVLSTNYGNNVAAVTGQAFSTVAVFSVTMSSDGSKMALTTASSVFYSINYGSTWTAGSTTPSIRFLSATDDFTKLYGYGSGGVYLSTNNGVSFTLQSNTIGYGGTNLFSNNGTGNNCKFQMSSATGQYGIAFSGGSAYRTSNYGVTWTQCTGIPALQTTTWSGAFMGISSTGQYAFVDNTNAGVGTNTSLFHSNNYAVSFNQSTIVGGGSAKSHRSTTISYSGRYGVCANYVTNDYGVNWRLSTQLNVTPLNADNTEYSAAISGNEQYNFLFSIFIPKISIQQNATTNLFSQSLIITEDISTNSRLFIANDVSMASNLYIGLKTIQAGDISANTRLFVGGDASFNGNVYIDKDLTVNGNFYVKAYTAKQVITELSYQLIVAQDISVNGRLFLSNDASINGRLFVGADVSFGCRLFVAGDVSMNSRLYVASDASLGARLFVAGDVSFNGNVYVTTQTSSDNSNKVATTAYVKSALTSLTGASSTFNGDVSINNRLYVGSDVSFQGKLFSAGDVTLNSRVYIGSDLSVNGNVGLNKSATLWVAVGEGTNSIATSTDGITWTGRTGTSIFSGKGRAVAYNGSIWVAVGDGTNTIATSTDGITWTGRGSSIFSSLGLGAAWNGSLWVAVGGGTNTIATSTDGINWTGRGTSIFSSNGWSVAYNGAMWVALGQGTNTIATSTDGINWTGRGTSIFSTYGFGAAWNGSLWVAVGQGTNTIATSTDGINWTGRGTSIFSDAGYKVAYNGSLWVAVGQGTNSIATSTDGITWTGRTGTSIFSSLGDSVAWNGSLWVAVGQGTNTIATSTDGINWTARSNTVFTLGKGVGYSSSNNSINLTLSNNNQLIVGGGLNILGDVSLNQRLYLGSDASVNGNISTRNIAVSGIVFQF